MKSFWEKFKTIITAVGSILITVLALFGWNSLNKKKTNKVIDENKDAIDDSKEQDEDRKTVKKDIKEVQSKNDETIAKNKELIEKLKGKL